MNELENPSLQFRTMGLNFKFLVLLILLVVNEIVGTCISSTSCNNAGFCNVDGECECDIGFAGDNCEMSKKEVQFFFIFTIIWRSTDWRTNSVFYSQNYSYYLSFNLFHYLCKKKFDSFSNSFLFFLSKDYCWYYIFEKKKQNSNYESDDASSINPHFTQ